MSQGNASSLQQVQAVRPVYKDGLPLSLSSTSRDGGVVLLTCHFDANTGLEFVLWEDILAVFHDALYIRYESRVLPFMKDTKFRTLDPQRIAAIPNATLEIVIECQVTHTQAGAPQDIPEQFTAGIGVPTPTGAGSTYYPPLLPGSSSSTQDSSSYISPPPPSPPPPPPPPPPSNTTPRAPVYLSGDYVDFRMYDHTPLSSDANYVPPTTPAQIEVNKVTDALSRTHLDSAGAGHQISEEGRGYTSRPGPQAIVDDRDDRSRPGPQAIVEDGSIASCQQQERTEQDRDHDTLQPSRHQSSSAHVTVWDDPYPTIDEDESHHSPTAATSTTTTRSTPQPLPQSQNQEPSSAHKSEADYEGAFTAYGVALEYENGLHGTPQDDEKAAVWYMTSAIRGYAPAQYSLAVMYDEGRGLPQSDTEAKRWYLLAAAQDHPKAAFNMGLFYENGQGVAKDYGAALTWFLKAAELGHVGAIYNVGVAFDQGKGVEQDFGKAFEWYVRAAEKEHASAEHNLGNMYEDGEAPGGQDHIKALEYYLRAAGRGHAKAQFSVGLLYDTGKDVDQDSRKALRWYLKSAEQDHAPAQFNVAFMYEHGEGVGRDLGRAFEWYLKAAGQGHAKAQYSVGMLYQSGVEGKVERDLRVAEEWLEKAAGQGHELARRDLEVVRILMKDCVSTSSLPAKIQVQVQPGSKGGFSKLKSLWKR